MTAAARIRPAIRFRGRSYLALVLAPVEPLDEWFSELDLLASRTPGFFAGRPVVLDLTGAEFAKAELGSILSQLSERSVRIMAVENAASHVMEPSFPPPISGGRDARPIDVEPQDRPVQPRYAMLLDQPVRSGQTISNPSGDVIVLGPVGSGAEIIAGGSIHVYGPLRGRAIAGTTGHIGARIFCRRLEAELLAIDGLYCTADSMDPKLRGRPAQAWLDGDAMLMASLD